MSARELITEHLDLWTGAVTKKSSSGRGSNGKVELTGINKLRELILELAVRGKLVEQDSSEEPACKLLERIAREKKLSGKKSKKLPPLSDDEKPFDVPLGWEATRYGEIVAVTTGKLDANAADENGQYPFFTCSRTPSAIDTYAFDCEAVLLAGNGDFNLKYYKGKFNAYQRTYVIEPIQISLKFLYYLTVSQIERITENNRGSAIRYLKLNDILMPFVYLPPVEEQYRIVQKVDELMALCDRLEQQTSDQLEAHETLVDTLLGTLTQSENATELADNWARLAAHFDTLFTTEQSIDKLKQTILQMAVMGRLVEQDARDEPVSAYLNRLSKASQVNPAKKRKPRVSAGEIPPEQQPRFFPSSWKLCHLGELAEFENGDRSARYPNSTDLVEHGIPFFGAKEIVDGKLQFTDELRFITPEKFDSLSNGKLQDGDFVILLRGMVGKIARFHASEEHATGFINAQMLIIRLPTPYVADYFEVFASSKMFKNAIAEKITGSAVKQMPASVLPNIVFPLPPPEEQRRIVQKVDELMTLCDQLKKRLNEASKTRCQLAESVVEGALKE